MTAKRTQIRDAITARLTGLATCGARVYASRLRPLASEELPAILVSTLGEEPDAATLGSNWPHASRLRVVLEIIVKASTGYESTADTILDEIKGALFDTAAHNTLSGLVLSIKLASIDDPEMDDSTDKPVVRLAVILGVTYSSS
jgi:hypothetical protein